MNYEVGTTNYQNILAEQLQENPNHEKNTALMFTYDRIKEPSLKKFALFCNRYIPDYFFSVAASSTGKYHPVFALGEGGLVRHTKVAVKIAEELLILDQNKDISGLSDEMYFALIFHDILKHGYPYHNHTVKDHPQWAAAFLNECYRRFLVSDDMKNYNKSRHTSIGMHVDIINKCILSHMGQWWKPEPITVAQNFVHMCDYLASRRFLSVNIEDLL
jgi:hypothetical protein